ncbi:MAG: hypothetical protein KGN36_19700, partial [Acidobacteriota bacterium]|nr:hypothetical protein [Acidobacteriota bacterium]
PRSDVLEDQFTIRGLLKPVYFAFDRSAITSSERPKLEAAWSPWIRIALSAGIEPAICCFITSVIWAGRPEANR